MKLRNKKTGKFIDSEDLFTDEFIIDLFSKSLSYFDAKLDEIQKEWELYKVPKDKYFFITWSGDVVDETDDGFDVDKSCKEIGNYFKTKKEAEKTVEKLKAWKRLKDKNFHFLKYSALGCGEIEFSLDFEDLDDEGEIGELQHDLDLLFGGEDD